MLRKLIAVLLALLLPMASANGEEQWVSAVAANGVPYYDLFPIKLTDGVWFEINSEWTAYVSEEIYGYPMATVVYDEAAIEASGGTQGGVTIVALPNAVHQSYNEETEALRKEGVHLMLTGESTENSRILESFTIDQLPARRVEMVGQGFEMIWIQDEMDLYFFMYPADGEAGLMAQLRAIAASLHVEEQHTPAPEVKADDFEWQIQNGQVTLTSYTGQHTRVNVPEEIGGLPVTAIADYCFYETDVTCVCLPESVKQLGEFAFGGCSQLQTVRLPKQLEKLSKGTFESCFRLHGIDLPEAMSIIEDEAFFGNLYLEYVSIPAALEQIGKNFAMCPLLKCFIVSEDCKGFKSEREGGVLLTEDGKRLICFAAWQDVNEYTVPDGVEIIDEYAFDDALLTGIVLPESVKEIGGGAFVRCWYLQSLTIPAGCENIGVQHDVTVTSMETGETYYVDEAEVNITSLPITIVGIPDSEAQRFAQQYGHTFKLAQ